MTDHVPLHVSEAASRVRWSPTSGREDANILATYVQTLPTGVLELRLDDFLCTCTDAERERSNAVLADVKDLLNAHDSNLLSVIVYDLDNLGAYISGIHTDQWGVVRGATYAEPRIIFHVQCDKVEHGVARLWQMADELRQLAEFEPPVETPCPDSMVEHPDFTSHREDGVYYLDIVWKCCGVTAEYGSMTVPKLYIETARQLHDLAREHRRDDP